MNKKYNDSLNLPRTDFPMKANLSSREPEILSKWISEDVYNKLLNKNKGKSRFILHDGPPYANGDIHLGHALNKILKDFIVKYKSMSGYFSPFVPGWDTHGLPTELKAKKTIKNYDRLSTSELRDACKNIASHYIDVQRDAFKRLGVFGDWENPYITFDPKFESKQLEVFAKLVKNGAIYRGAKPVYWCSSCKTALAEAEIEYHEDDCISIYVKFKVKNDFDKLKKLDIDLDKTYFLIWTTTAWTLPANVAICVNPSFDYSVVKINDEFLILASELVDQCMNVSNISNYSVVGTISGKLLEGIVSYHPFLDRDSLVITGEHVNLETGTGCVHTAPGHGIEDYECCKNYNFDLVVSLDADGFLTSEAGQFKGLSSNDGSNAIIEYLESNNYLFGKKNIVHKYPHCWRCKEPVVFRATDQWFCSVNSFKKDAIEESKKVNWIPSWGLDRMPSMLSERTDWCISRQRRWGVPIPAFFCKNCNTPLIDYDLVMHISKIFNEFGSNIWYEKDAKFFLDDDISCKYCGSNEFVKEEDVMDVWFDSGSTHHAVLSDSEFPADLYLEGSDQYRGWFQSSLLTSVGMGKGAPYRSVLTHGWVLDEQARKQSKSLGNVISPFSVVKQSGADILRLWVASVKYTYNVKISNEILSQISESYRKIRNTARFILGNLYDFVPSNEVVSFDDLCQVDKFILIKFQRIFEKSLMMYDKFEFYNIFHDIQNFCIIDLSNFYLDIIKDRLYVQKKDDITRKSAQTTIWVILSGIAKLLAPILSFTCEEIWNYIPKANNIDSVFLSDLKIDYVIKEDSDLEKYWNYILKISGAIKKNLEIARANKIIGSSLEAIVHLKHDSLPNSSEFLKDLKEVCMVSKVVFSEQDDDISVSKSDFGKCQRCWSLDETVGKNSEHMDLCERCISVLY